MSRKTKVKKFLTQNWHRIVVVFAMIALIAIAGWVLKKDPNLASPAVALGTLTLALVTVLSIFIANDREKRHREHELDRERRDRKERLLKEIRDWATDISIAGLKFTSVSSTDRELWITTMEQIANTFSVLYRRSVFIKRIILLSWGELGVIVEELKKQLLIHIEHLNAYKEDPIDKNLFKLANDHRDEVNKLTSRVIDEASKILSEGLD